MQIREGISLELADSSWVRLDVEVGTDDLRALVVEWGVHSSQLAQLPLQGQAIALRAFSKQLLAQMSIEERSGDGTNWVATVGQPRLDVQEQMLGSVRDYLLALPVKENSDVWASDS